MFVELIATVFAGIGCAGVVMLINILTGRRLPKWLMPVGAGLGMIAMTVEEQSWLRPWTQLRPYTKRFVAADVGQIRRHVAQPDARLVDLYFFGRWSPVNQMPMLLDCAEAQSAVLIDGATFAADGSVADADWQAMPDNDPILTLVCET